MRQCVQKFRTMKNLFQNLQFPLHKEPGRQASGNSGCTTRGYAQLSISLSVNGDCLLMGDRCLWEWSILLSGVNVMKQTSPTVNSTARWSVASNSLVREQLRCWSEFALHTTTQITHTLRSRSSSITPVDHRVQKRRRSSNSWEYKHLLLKKLPTYSLRFAIVLWKSRTSISRRIFLRQGTVCTGSVRATDYHRYADHYSVRFVALNNSNAVA